jgi:hypothetical protein
MKNFILVLFIALGTAMLSAQNPEVVYQPLTSSFAAQTEPLFGQMNLTQASTGFLLEIAT